MKLKLKIWMIAACLGILAVLLVSVYLFQVERQHRFIKHVQSMGGEVFYRLPADDVVAVAYADSPQATYFGRALPGQALYIDLSSSHPFDRSRLVNVLCHHSQRVEVLDLSNQPVTDHDVQKILECVPGLQFLGLSNTSISGDCLQHVIELLPGLYGIDLSNTLVSSHRLLQLTKAHQLKTIKLVNVKIGEEVLSKLRSALPGTKIVIEHPREK